MPLDFISHIYLSAPSSYFPSDIPTRKVDLPINKDQILDHRIYQSSWLWLLSVWRIWSAGAGLCRVKTQPSDSSSTWQQLSQQWSRHLQKQSQIPAQNTLKFNMINKNAWKLFSQIFQCSILSCSGWYSHSQISNPTSLTVRPA